MDFELNLSLEELNKRTSKECFEKNDFLNESDTEFKELSVNEKNTLAHLARASMFVEKAYYKMENSHNIEFQKFLKEEISKGNEQAKLTKILFDAQKSMFSADREGNHIRLVKNLTQPVSMNFYPEDLTIPEFHSIINKMLDEKKVEDIKNMLTQHSMVVRDGKFLKGIEYNDYFTELKDCANELEQASKTCEDPELKKYLTYQVSALRNNNLEYDCLADLQWAKFKNGKIDFTLTRESYDDQMTESIGENFSLAERLKNLNIEYTSKDTLGARVGLINKEGTNFLQLTAKNIAQVIYENMPFQDRYEQNNLFDGKDKLSSIELDLVCLTGGEGCYQAGIVLAQSLPNNDKLAIKRGGGKRNVYHKQIRDSKQKYFVEKLVVPELKKYLNYESKHWQTICHENTHPFGPKENTFLGSYNSIIEENKADLGAFAFLPEMVKAKIFNNGQCKQILLSTIVTNFVKSKPSLQEPHVVERIMITNKMIENKAISVNEKAQISVDFKKAIEVSKDMMKEIVELQLSKSSEKAKAYVEKYFVWTEKLERVAKVIRENSKILNGTINEPLKDYLISPKFELECSQKKVCGKKDNNQISK
ncbi:MAG: hypothetical protein WCR30_01960 [Clostridia bacterium]